MRAQTNYFYKLNVTIIKFQKLLKKLEKKYEYVDYVFIRLQGLVGSIVFTSS